MPEESSDDGVISDWACGVLILAIVTLTVLGCVLVGCICCCNGGGVFQSEDATLLGKPPVSLSSSHPLEQKILDSNYFRMARAVAFNSLERKIDITLALVDANAERSEDEKVGYRRWWILFFRIF